MKYKKLLLRNVFGKPVNTNLGEGNGVTTVSILPLTGEAGRIYYNTKDGKYYVYSQANGFSEIGNVGIPIVLAEDTKHTYMQTLTVGGKTTINYGGTDDDFANGATGAPANLIGGTRDTAGYYLEANKFYELGEVSDSFRLYCVNNSKTEVKEYMGRFTVTGNDNLTLTCLRGAASVDTPAASTIEIIAPDDTPDLEPGHTYEFNISASVLAIKDITYTNNP